MGRVELESRPSDTQAWKFSLGPWSVVKTKKRVLGFALVWRRASVSGLAGPLPARGCAGQERGCPCWDPGLPGSTALPMVTTLAVEGAAGWARLSEAALCPSGALAEGDGETVPQRDKPMAGLPWEPSSSQRRGAFGGRAGRRKEGRRRRKRCRERGCWAGRPTREPTLAADPH